MTRINTIGTPEPVLDQSVIDTDLTPAETPKVEEPIVEEALEEKIEKPVAEEPPETKPTRKQQKTYQEFSMDSKVKLDTGEIIGLPSDSIEVIEQTLNNTPNISLLDSAKGREWASVMRDGSRKTMFANVFQDTVEDQDAEFRQYVDHNNIKLGGTAPKFKEQKGQELSGDKAIIHSLAHLGLGHLFQAPMWHSGFWVTFQPPSETEMIELNRLLIADKITMGRYSYGLAFANATSYTTDRLMNFAIEHVYQTSVRTEDMPISQIRKYLKSQDIPSFLWGFLNTRYPRGFRYQRACCNDPAKCNHVVTDTLNLSKLQWTNSKPLTDWQKTHMTKRAANSSELKSVQRYQEEMSKLQNHRVVLNEGQPTELAFILKSPDVDTYVNAGHRWIGGIVEAVEKAIGSNAGSKERDDTIESYARASMLCQYTHWIDSIEFLENTVKDQDTIENLLARYSADDHIRGELFEAVTNYINKSSISVIGIPVYDCPACGTTQESTSELPAYKNIIPIDVIQVFFDLITQLIDRLRMR